MTRPLDRHLDNAEIDALVSMSTAGNGGSVGLSGEDVQQCQRHAESCEDCGYKVRMHEHAQADFARLRPAGFVESSARCPEAAAWLQVAAGLLGETRARELMTHAAQCDHCGPMLRDAVATVADESTGEEEQIVATLRSSHGKWQGLSRDPSQGSPARLQVQRWWTSPTIWLRWEIAVGLLALVMAAAWWSFRSFEMNSPDRLLAAAYTERRTLEMRTEGARYAPLRQTRGADRSQSRMEQPTSLLDAEALVARNLKSHPRTLIGFTPRGSPICLRGIMKLRFQLWRRRGSLHLTFRQSPSTSPLRILCVPRTSIDQKTTARLWTFWGGSSPHIPRIRSPSSITP